MSYDASMYELQQFRKQMEETEKLPLAERKANALEWYKDLSDNYKMIAERVGWLLQGNYGGGSYGSACRVLASPRMNQVAWCAITIANLEWRTPAKMAIMAWKKLPVETRYQVNEAIRREIADAKAEGYCGEIKKNGKKLLYASFNRFEIGMPKEAVADMSASGRVDDSVAYWENKIKIDASPDDIRAELKEYGAWDKEDLEDDDANRRRILWIGAGNIKEEMRG
jgi:hypothetical protein